MITDQLWLVIGVIEGHRQLVLSTETNQEALVHLLSLIEFDPIDTALLFA